MNTANLVTSDLTRSIPYSSYSMEFDGTNDYIDFGSNAFFDTTNSFSFSAWVNLDSYSTNYPYIANIKTNVTDGFAIFLSNAQSGGYAGVNIGSTDSNITTGKTTGNISADFLTSWNHIVVTYNGSDATTLSNYSIYVNGLSVALTTTGTFSTVSNVNNLGRLGSGSFHFDGNLSNCSIYSSALTEDQILTIYNGGVPNSISSLSPVSWWSLAGDSYYNGSDWICPDLGSGSNNGTSFNMAGTELVGNGPGSTANGIATSMNIPGNLKGNAPNSSKNAFSVNMTAADRVFYDAEAMAFINAAGITDATQQLAIKTLVSSLQSNNLWTNMKAIYPMVGGTATTHKYNLKDPQDTDSAFRLTFDGGWTHSANGALPNGTNGRANSHLVLNNEISSVNALSYGYYSRDISDVGGLYYDMGSYQGGDISIMIIQWVNTLRYSANQNTYEVVSNTHTDGFFVANRSGATAIEAYRNGSSIDTGTDASTGLSSNDFGIGGIYGTGGYGNKECAFAFIYDGSLDATQNLNLYNAVQAFNTTLGRQV